MATGTQRREGVTDSLAGQAEVNPVIPTSSELHIPNTRVPAAPNVVNSREAQLAASLTNWMGQKWQQRADVEHEASVLDGQMAYQQGQALEDLEMEGDKWANQGYRVMQAQAMSASLLSAQQEMIRQSQYADDPDTFRQSYVNRLNQTIEGLDPQTARMVRENMANQMPALVSQHTQAYMQNQEQNTYDTLVESVHLLSQDPSSFGDLIANAMEGEDSGSQMLSADRRMAALADGVVASFDRMNPVAYQQLKASGAMDDMPTALVNQINAAEARFQQRARAEFNPELQRGLQSIQERIDAGSYSGDQQSMIDDMVALYAEHNLTLNANEARIAYAGQREAEIMDQTREVIAIQTAQARGDYATVGNLTQPMINNLDAGGGPASFRAMAERHIFPGESGGDYDALFGFSQRAGGQFAGVRVTDMTINEALEFANPNGAYGQWVKPQTRTNEVSTPMGAYQIVGRTLRAARDAMGLTGNERMTPAMQDRIGQWIYDNQGAGAWEGWEGGDPGYSQHQVTMTRTGKFSWVENVEHYGGDTTLAAIAYRDGRETADAYRESGDESLISAETAGYIAQLDRQIAGEDIYQTSAQRLSIAQSSLQSAQALREGVLRQQAETNQMQAEHDLETSMAFANRRLEAGLMSYSQYEALYNQRREARDVEQTRGTLQYLARQRDHSVTMAARREEAAGRKAEADAMWGYKAAQADLDVSVKQQLQNPNLSASQIAEIGAQWQRDSYQLTRDHGIDVRDTPLNTQVEEVMREVNAANRRRETAEMEGRMINSALEHGTVADLPPRLQAKAFEAMDKQAMASTQQLIETGEIPEEAMGQEIAAQSFQNWIRAGTVDEESRNKFSASMVNNLVTPDGEASPGAVNALLAYAGMLDSGHRGVAQTMFKSGQAENRAAQLLAAAGGPTATPEDISHALITAQNALGRDTGGRSGQIGGRNTMSITDASALVAEEVSDYLDRENIGWVQSLFDKSVPGTHGIGDTFLRAGSNEAVLFTEENEALLNDLILAEVERRRALDPMLGLPMSNLVDIAVQDVFSRTSVVADQIVTMEPGYAIVDQMFGENASSFRDIPGIEERVIKAYIAHQAEQNPEQWGMLVGSSFGEKFFQPFVDASAAVFGTEQYAITGEDARQVGLSDTGVRPLGMYPTGGQHAEFYVVGQNGVDIALPWSLEEMGAFYHEQQAQAAEQRADNLQ